MNLTLRKAVYSLLVFSYVLPSFAQQSLESMFDKKDSNLLLISLLEMEPLSHP
ncbi:hypothetical protein [Algoriphagus aquimarinus]|uniref:hypothetical protein n=1 Tax=Algoriphagus aquimarinus TaxID=237018 RepID=UPI0030D8DF90